MDVSSGNVYTTHRVIELISTYRFDAIQEYIHEDIVVDIPFPAFHQGPIKRGKEAFMDGVRFIPNIFKTFNLNIHATYDCPEQDSVIFEQTSFGLFHENKGTFQNRYILIFGFRDEKIVLWREYFNPETMNSGMLCLVDQ